MRMFKNDMQRNDSYRWEDNTFLHNEKKMSNDDLRLVFDELCKFCGIKDAYLALDPRDPIFQKIRWKAQSSTSWYVGLNNRKTPYKHLIWLSPPGRKVSILLHEFAHLFVALHIEKSDVYKEVLRKKMKNHRIAIHGAEWMTVYMIFLNRFTGVSMDMLRISAFIYKLKYIPELLEKYGKS